MTDLTFKIAKLKTAKDGEPRVATYTIQSFVKLIGKPKLSKMSYEKYHLHKAEQKRFAFLSKEAHERGDKAEKIRLSAEAKSHKDALSIIKDGAAVMPFIFENDVTYKIVKNGWKQRDNSRIQSFSLVMLDIESNITKEQIHEVLREYEYVLWPSISHRPDDPRFRVVLFPAEPLLPADAQALIYRVDALLPANNALDKKTQAIDSASLEEGRLMYLPCWLSNHPEQYFYVQNEGKLLNASSFELTPEQQDVVQQRIELAAATKEKTRQTNVLRQAALGVQSASVIEKDGKLWLNPTAELQTDTGWITVQDIDGHISGVACPAHGDVTGSEFVDVNQYGRPYLHCKHCGTIRMLSKPSDEPARLVLVKRKKPAIQEAVQESQVTQDAPEAAQSRNEGLVFQEPENIQILNERYLPIAVKDMLPKRGVMLVKSPKGTGKTELLQHICADLVKRKDRTLLLGHRVFLMKNIAERLNMDCYHGMSVDEIRGSDELALCMNSLTKIDTNDEPYDTLIIDESEQVLRHLISNTMRTTRPIVVSNLFWVLKNAKRVICLDADLTDELTIYLLQTIRGDPITDNNVAIINNYVFAGRSTVMYQDGWHLFSEMIADAQRGVRCYVASNNKQRLNVIAAILEQSNIPHLNVNADTNDEDSPLFDPRCPSFILDPTTESINYQVVLASPTAQTGISLDEVDGKACFDRVYGFFDNNIGTFQDIDQALSRVRGCNDIRTWVQQVTEQTPEKTEKEIHADLIEKESKHRTATRVIIQGEEHHFTKGEWTWSYVYARLAHLTHLWERNKYNQFNELRKSTGYEITEVPEDETEASLGKAMYKAAEAALVAPSRAAAIMAAPDIDEELFFELSKKRSKTQEEKLLLDRAKYQRALGEEFTLENVQKGIQQNLLATLKQLEITSNWSDEDRAMYDAATRPTGSITFTDGSTHLIRTQLLESICAAADMKYSDLTNDIKAAAESNSQVTVSPEQLLAMAAHFEKNKRDYALFFESRIKDPTNEKTVMKVWNAVFKDVLPPLKKKRVRVNGEDTKTYVVDWEKKDVIWSRFGKAQ